MCSAPTPPPDDVGYFVQVPRLIDLAGFVAKHEVVVPPPGLLPGVGEVDTRAAAGVVPAARDPHEHAAEVETDEPHGIGRRHEAAVKRLACRCQWEAVSWRDA